MQGAQDRVQESLVGRQQRRQRASELVGGVQAVGDVVSAGLDEVQDPLALVDQADQRLVLLGEEGRQPVEAVEELAKLGLPVVDRRRHLVDTVEQLGELVVLALGDVSEVLDELVELGGVGGLQGPGADLGQFEDVERRLRPVVGDDPRRGGLVLQVRLHHRA